MGAPCPQRGEERRAQRRRGRSSGESRRPAMSLLGAGLREAPDLQSLRGREIAWCRECRRLLELDDEDRLVLLDDMYDL